MMHNNMANNNPQLTTIHSEIRSSEDFSANSICVDCGRSIDRIEKETVRRKRKCFKEATGPNICIVCWQETHSTYRNKSDTIPYDNAESTHSGDFLESCDNDLLDTVPTEHLDLTQAWMRQLACPYCHKAFIDGGNLFYHITSSHRPSVKVCNKCFKTFVNEAKLQKHVARRHPTMTREKKVAYESSNTKKRRKHNNIFDFLHDTMNLNCDSENNNVTISASTFTGSSENSSCLGVLDNREEIHIEIKKIVSLVNEGVFRSNEKEQHILANSDNALTYSGVELQDLNTDPICNYNNDVVEMGRYYSSISGMDETEKQGLQRSPDRSDIAKRQQRSRYIQQMNDTLNGHIKQGCQIANERFMQRKSILPNEERSVEIDSGNLIADIQVENADRTSTCDVLDSDMQVETSSDVSRKHNEYNKLSSDGNGGIKELKYLTYLIDDVVKMEGRDHEEEDHSYSNSGSSTTSSSSDKADGDGSSGRSVSSSNSDDQNGEKHFNSTTAKDSQDGNCARKQERQKRLKDRLQRPLNKRFHFDKSARLIIRRKQDPKSNENIVERRDSMQDTLNSP